MKKQALLITISVSLISLGLVSSADAALVSRLNGLAYYDTVSNLTWLADANAAAGSSWDTSFIPGSGLMDWGTANEWAARLNIDGVTGWRLPTTSPVNGSSFNYNFSTDGSTDVGYNTSASSSEMANLFYNVLGNKGFYDSSGAYPQAGWGLTNTGPFSNVQASDYAIDPTVGSTVVAWSFSMGNGYQGGGDPSAGLYAWAVHTGDVSAVPVPAAAWLFGSGLLGLVGIARRKKA